MSFTASRAEGAPGEATWTMPATGLCLMGVTYDNGILED